MSTATSRNENEKSLKLEQRSEEQRIESIQVAQLLRDRGKEKKNEESKSRLESIKAHRHFLSFHDSTLNRRNN